MATPALFSFVIPTLFLPIPALQSSAQRSAPPAVETAAAPASLSWGDVDGDGRLDALSITAEGRLRLLASPPRASRTSRSAPVWVRSMP